MGIIVQKFGGTSVSSKESRLNCFEKIAIEINKGNKVIAVVSAMGREGDPYATDSLINLSPTISGRSKDLLMNAGETISSCIFSNELNEKAFKSAVLTGGQAGILTNDEFNNASISLVKPDRLFEELQLNDVVVVTGFQGRTSEGEITTLGRGGSDTSAVALGVGTEAERVDIFTDVKGLMTTDPRIEHNAKIIREASYNEVLNLSYSGSKIVHPRAIELAMKFDLPLSIKSTFVEDDGTLISGKGKNESRLENPYKLITGIAHMNQQKKVTINESLENRIQILREIEEADISLDMITINESSLTFVIKEYEVNKLKEILKNTSSNYKIDSTTYSKIALVGEKISGVSGVMKKVVESACRAGIDIKHSTDSNTTLWILVDESETHNCICSLHEDFF